MAQARLVSHRQLAGVGFSEREIAGLVRRHRLHRRFPGVYAVGVPALEDRGELIASLLALDGRDPFLSHRGALFARGLTPVLALPVELTVVTAHTPSIAGLRVHRTRRPPHPDEVERVRGLRTSSVARMLVELAPDKDTDELHAIVRDAIHQKAFDPDDLQRTIARHRRRPGIAHLRAAMATYIPGAPPDSRWEIDFKPWLLGLKGIPVPLTNHPFLIYRLDFYWPVQRLVLELDSRRWHSALQDMDRDRRKDTVLQRHGLNVIRVTEHRWHHERAALEDDIYAFHGLRPR